MNVHGLGQARYAYARIFGNQTHGPDRGAPKSGLLFHGLKMFANRTENLSELAQHPEMDIGIQACFIWGAVGGRS